MSSLNSMKLHLLNYKFRMVWTRKTSEQPVQKFENSKKVPNLCESVALQRKSANKSIEFFEQQPDEKRVTKACE